VRTARPDHAPLRTHAVRRGVIALAWASVGVTGVELAMERHWQTSVQVIPWVALAAVAVALTLLARGARTAVVRAIAIAVLVVAAVGVLEHVVANHDAGPLDQRYASRWASMTAASQWWTAATGGVGPAPPLAPAVLAGAAALVLLATVEGGPADAPVPPAPSRSAGRETRVTPRWRTRPAAAARRSAAP
jgi:hypothetical protein